MPRFVNDPVGIEARITEPKSVPRRVSLKPMEGGGGLKCLGQRRTSWSADVHCPAGVVFAESRCRINRKNDLQRGSSLQFSAHDVALVDHTSKSGNQQERNSLGGGRIAQRSPGSRRFGFQLELAAVGEDPGHRQLARLDLQGQVSLGAVIRGNVESDQFLRDSSRIVGRCRFRRGSGIAHGVSLTGESSR